MYRRAQLFLVGNALLMGVLAVVAATTLNKRLADPEGFLGPAWVRLPAMLAIAVMADLVPRAIWRARFRPRQLWPHIKGRIVEHWDGQRLIAVIGGVLSFYAVYVSYRNLKSFLPFISDARFDRELNLLDTALFLGTHPATVLHSVLGENLSAHVLSYIYLWFLPMVPISITAWLIWARPLQYAYWFAVAQCIAWTLGTLSYYLMPTLGPGFEYAWLYRDLAHTQTTELMEALSFNREDVQHNGIEGEVQSVAGFASLHCAITLLLAMLSQATIKWRWFNRILWANFAITIVATLYFGWHYIADDVAGIAIAIVSYYVGGRVCGITFDRHGARVVDPVGAGADTLGVSNVTKVN